MFGKDSASKKEAVDEYFKHWDNKKADVETEEVRKARRDEYATLTRQYVLTHLPSTTISDSCLTATTTSLLIFTSMDGELPSTSAASLFGNLSIKPSLVTNITSLYR